MDTPSADRSSAALTLHDLTINICTVDRPQALRAAIQSLLDTTPAGPTLQLVLNEASEATWPAVGDLVERWPGPVKVIRIDERVPVTQSHQRALSEVETALVNFMGDDDFVFADRFTDAIALFNSVPDLKMVGTFCRRIGGDFDQPVKRGHMDIGPVTLDEWEQYRRSSTPVQYCFPAVVFDTEAVRSVGGFQDRFGSAVDVALTGLIGRRWPALTQTERRFGFRIHDGSDSTMNFGHQYERFEYFVACLRALDAGQPEPTFDEWKGAMEARPWYARVLHARKVKSRHLFRRAGAALVDGRSMDFARFAAGSFVAWPPQFVSKAIEQRGRDVGVDV